MSVYQIAQITIKDRDEYTEYANKFFGVFEKFDGKILSADWSPKVVAGDWNATRSVLLEFPDKASWRAWITSPEYIEISKHRIAGADVNAILVKSLNHEE